MDIDKFIWPVAVCLGLASVLIYVLWLFVHKGADGLREQIGLLKINDFIVEKVRHKIIAECNGFKTGKLKRKQAQHELWKLTRKAIAEAFKEVYGREFPITRSWPDADVIISGNFAVIDPWIGLDWGDDGEGIKPVMIEIDRPAVLKLDTRPPLKQALSESHGLPSTRKDDHRQVANGGGKAGVQAPAAKPKPTRAALKR